MPTYLQSSLHTGFNQALLIAVISNAGFALTIIPSGMLSDRIGRRTVMVTAAVLLLILALAYSLSNAIFSGCAGLIISGLIKQTGNLDIPAYYVMATAVVSVIALMTLRKDDHQRSLEE